MWGYGRHSLIWQDFSNQMLTSDRRTLPFPFFRGHLYITDSSPKGDFSSRFLPTCGTWSELEVAIFVGKDLFCFLVSRLKYYESYSDAGFNEFWVYHSFPAPHHHGPTVLQPILETTKNQSHYTLCLFFIYVKKLTAILLLQSQYTTV